jgi:hypothetical protein
VGMRRSKTSDPPDFLRIPSPRFSQGRKP